MKRILRVATFFVVFVTLSLIVPGMPVHADLTNTSSPPSRPLSDPSTYWFAGSVYPSTSPTQNATAIYATIRVPYSAPLQDDYYYTLLSAWDSNQSYDQIGFCARHGLWGLVYSWTTQDTYGNLKFYPTDQSQYDNEKNLSLGTTYIFYIETVSLYTYFNVYNLDGTQFYSATAPTGGNYLILSNLYYVNDYIKNQSDYQNYEEVKNTQVTNGAPNSNFYFYNQRWVSTNGTSYVAAWTPFTYAVSGFSIPDGVNVGITDDAVVVRNPNTGSDTFPNDATLSGQQCVVRNKWYTYVTTNGGLDGDGDPIRYSFARAGPGYTYHYRTMWVDSWTSMSWNLIWNDSDSPGVYLLDVRVQDVWGTLSPHVNSLSVSLNATLSVSTGTGGSTSPSPGTYSCLYGSFIPVTANPQNAYSFGHWSLDGQVSYSNPINVSMTGDHNLMAYFIWTPGCPYVSAWNGSQYVLDNNLLAASMFSQGADVNDHYVLQQTPAQNPNGTYSLQLSEFENEHDFIDKVQLLAIDHASNVNVGVSPNGEILTYADPNPPVSAITDTHENVKRLLSAIDGTYYEAHNGSYVTLNFGDLDVGRGAKLVLRADYNKDPVYVQVQDLNGRWTTVARVIPRVHWSTDIIDMSKFLPDAGGNMKVRLYFTADLKVDFVGLDTSPQATLNIHKGQLVSAISSAEGDITAKLLHTDQTYAELVPGENIQLKFTLPTQTMETRTYIIIARGHYYTVTP